ncbi:hypothetical protein D9756_010221 [Leucocoprinus leucothites]|uniref:Uncharacterized protein n=1 Tax=Leucocoprinus leucothites TaxID=201217 RepID=A0A8H5FTB3_9AGAR|nr:hypothetical protein D9756_010221 [Leucoagaricus leucothites]
MAPAQAIAINGRFQRHSLLISNHHDGQQVTQTIAQGRRTRPSHQSWPSMAILAHHPCFLCHPSILQAIANHDHTMTIPPPPAHHPRPSPLASGHPGYPRATASHRPSNLTIIPDDCPPFAAPSWPSHPLGP